MTDLAQGAQSAPPVAGRIVVDGTPLAFEPGDSVALAMLRAGQAPLHGGTLCLAGDCPNCLATVDGVSYVRSCQVACRPAGLDGDRLGGPVGVQRKRFRVQRFGQGSILRTGRPIHRACAFCTVDILTGSIDRRVDKTRVPGRYYWHEGLSRLDRPTAMFGAWRGADDTSDAWSTSRCSPSSGRATPRRSRRAT